MGLPNHWPTYFKYEVKVVTSHGRGLPTCQLEYNYEVYQTSLIQTQT